MTYAIVAALAAFIGFLAGAMYESMKRAKLVSRELDDYADKYPWGEP